MHFIGSEARKQSKYVEKSVSVLREALANKVVIASLGEVASRMASYCENVFVPNVRHGHVKLPAKYSDTNRLPVIATDPSKSYVVSADYASLNLRQQNAAHRIIEDSHLAESETASSIVDRLITDIFMSSVLHPPEKIQISSSVNARVVALSAVCQLTNKKTPAGTMLLYSGRPFMMLNMLNGSPNGNTYPDIFAHELVHVAQTEDMPLHLDFDASNQSNMILGNELEAYHYGALAVSGMKAAGFLEIEGNSQTEIDRIRLNNLQPGLNEYAPHEALLSQLAAANLYLR